jgi:hypothetical protein
MSRNRNRRRLRELCQRDPAPLLYTCTSAESIRRSLPPDVLAQIEAAVCACCNAAVVAHRGLLADSREQARRQGLHLAVVCGACSTAVSRGSCYTTVEFVDASMAARLEAWLLEAN